jgi:tetratricopeptide (TPR) repeat protein
VFLSATTLFAIVNARRRPYLLVGWLWYLVSLLPMIGLIQIGPQRMANRYVYFPLLGVYTAIAWLVPTLVPAATIRSRLLPMTATGVVGLFAAIAFVQVGYWRDSVTLYHHSLAAAEDNSQARIRLGTALLVRGQLGEAMTHLRQAVQMDPGSAQAHFALGGGFLALSDWDDAADQFRLAVACDQAFAAGHGNLGFVLYKQRQYAVARRELDRALEIDENYVQAYVDRAVLCNELGQYGAAIASSQRALELDPTLLVCHRLIAIALCDQGRLDEAIKELQAALAISPNDAETRAQLARFLEMKASRAQPARP